MTCMVTCVLTVMSVQLKRSTMSRAISYSKSDIATPALNQH